ncbi:hypothetical protein Dimus_001799 [Dionaea muscipula]
MCPLRFILVFFSAVLAGYVAWRSLRSPSLQNDDDDRDAGLLAASEDSSGEKMELDNGGRRSLKRMTRDGIWMFIDMASGRYLWRNFKEIKKAETENKSS